VATEIDPELAGCVQQALFNAYFRDLQELVNKYGNAGLDEQRMVEAHTWPDGGSSGLSPNIWFEPGILGSSTGCQTITEALECETAQKVHIEGKLVFERVNGEWMYVET